MKTQLGNHFRKEYIGGVLDANKIDDTQTLNELFFPTKEIIIPPKDILDPTPEELLNYYYSIRKKKFIEHYSKRFNVSFFGSARSKKSDQEYKFVQELNGNLIEELKTGTVTGGGPGLMEAAAVAAMEARTKRRSQKKESNIRTIGVTIQLPFEEIPAPADKRIQHEGFFTRIPDMFDFSKASYVAPGGIGSILELFAVLQLKQVDHLEKQYPLIIHPIYEKMLESVEDTMYKIRNTEGLTEFISLGDIAKNVVVSDHVPTIVDNLKEAHAWWHENFRTPYKKIKATR